VGVGEELHSWVNANSGGGQGDGRGGEGGYECRMGFLAGTGELYC
jgi:hypothetical protein